MFFRIAVFRTLLSLVIAIAVVQQLDAAEYAVVVSKSTAADAGWAKVVERLVAKRKASVITYDQQVNESLVELKNQFPRFVCFVATPKEANRSFVAQTHRLSRQLDDDPFTDVLWGLLTGFDAENAQKIAAAEKPLVIKKVGAGTEIELACCTEGRWYCELKKQKTVAKLPGTEARAESGPADTTAALGELLSSYQADLFVTSGHATERDWQIGFAYRNGQFRSQAGQLYGLDTAGKKFLITSSNPKAYLAVGNCLMGNIDGPDAMALAWLNSAGVHQMVGYTVPTWYGYAGWGMLDYFVEQPGRFTLAEAFFANQQALLHKLEAEHPKIARENPEPGNTRGSGDGAGLLHDRDVVAFYGDPAWSVRMADGPLRWEQTLTERDGKFTLKIIPKAGAKSFEPVNKNGSQRGGRPIIALLPRRLNNVVIESGADLKPTITDDFVLVPLPRSGKVQPAYEIVFRGDDAK